MVAFILPANSATGGYEISNSLRMGPSGGDTTPHVNLRRTLGSAGTEEKFTYSCWVKISAKLEYNFWLLGGSQEASSPNQTTFFRISSDGKLRLSDGSVNLNTNRLFRDPSAWYHIVLAVDSTQGTDSNRVKIYVNGVQETSFANETYPSQNLAFRVLENGVTQTIGTWIADDGTAYACDDGYISEVYLIDGAQKAPTDFGETNDNGVWIPKDYSGTYGTHGFRFEFKQTGSSANSSGIGADTSGNDNHFSVNNSAATDITTDTPQNNFCTINSVFSDAGTNTVAADYSEGNTKLLKTVDAWGHGRGTFLLSSGKWYAEAKVTETGTGEAGQFGIVPSVLSGTTDANDKIEGLRVNMGGSSTIFQKMDTGTGSNVFTDFASEDIVMLAIDLDNNKLWVGNDGTWYNNNNASTTLSPSNHDVTLPSNDVGWIFTIGGYTDGGNNLAWEFNWGNPSFSISSSNADANGYGNMEFAVPSGFYTCCTKNLAEYG